MDLWNNGDPAIATSDKSGTTILSAVAVSDYNSAGTYTCDGAAPYLSPYYLRSTNAGGTWSPPKRMSTQPQPADRATVATSGAYVYVAYMDAGGVAGQNAGGEGAIVALAGNSTIGISMSECNPTSVTGSTSVCDWTKEKDREPLLYWQSNDNGSTWASRTRSSSGRAARRAPTRTTSAR